MIKRFKVEYIDKYIKENKITKIEFCKRCNITLNILRSVYNQKNITADKVFKVAYILNIRVDEFLFRKKIST